MLLTLSVRDCRAPDRGVMLLAPSKGGPGVEASPPSGACTLCGLRAKGVTGVCALAAILGVIGVRLMERAAAALSWGCRGLSPTGILAALAMVERVVVVGVRSGTLC